MKLFLEILCTLSFWGLVECDVGFNLDLSPQEIIFGESILVNMTITPNEHIQDQTLEVRFSPNLTFDAFVRSTTCDSTNNCATSTKNLRDTDLSNTGRFVFVNRVIEESKQLVVVQNTSNWEGGYSHHTEIQLSNVASTDFRGREFVVGVFIYWNQPKLSNEENGVQHYADRNFTLYPAKINLFIDGVTPNKTADLNKIYSGIEKSITLAAETDPRAGPLLMKVEFPTTALARCPTQGAVCNSTVSLLRNVKSSYSVGQGKGANTAIDVPPPAANVPSSILRNGATMLLTPDMLTDGSGGSCSGSCKANLTTVVLTDDQYDVTGQQINVSASIYYGPNFTQMMETQPVFMTIVGPDLDLSLVADPNSNLEAGMDVQMKASLKHSSTSTEDLVVTKVAFTFPDEDAIKLVSGSGTLSKNGGAAQKFSDANITEGVLIGDFPLGNTADIVFKVTLTDALPLATKLPMKVGANFGFKRSSDSCLPGPCKHGGTCVPATNGQPAACLCTSDFSGTDCSKRVCKRGDWKLPTDTSDTCYYFPNQVLPFSAAQQACAQLGTGLPAIHSIASDIWDLASFWMTTLPNVSEIWIGLSRDSKLASWKWSDGSPVTFMDWYDDNQEISNGNCVVSNSASSSNYRWLVKDCSVAHYFFCVDPPKAINGTQRYSSRNVDANLVTKSLNLKADLGLGDRIRVHQPVTMTINFAMPLGTLRNAKFDSLFTSDQINPIPIVFMSSYLSIPSSMNCSRLDILHAKTADFVINGQASGISKYREKRAAPSGPLSVTRPLGTLVNSAKGGQSGAPVSLNVTFLTPGSSATNFSGSNFSMNASMNTDGASVQLGSKQSMFSQADLMFNKSFQPSPNSPAEILVTAVVSHSPKSTGSAYGVNYVDDLQCLRVRRPSKDITFVSSCKEIRATMSSLDVGEQMTMTYAIVADKGLDYEASFRNATINFTSIQPGEFLYQEYPGQKGAMEVSTCIFRKDDVTVTDLKHLHVYSTLAFFLAILLSTLVILLTLYYCWKYKRHIRTAPGDEERLLNDDAGSAKSSAGIIAALKQKAKGDFSQQAVDIGTLALGTQTDDTIITALTEPSPQQMYRRLDRMDVSANVGTEEELNSSKLQNFLDSAAAVATAAIADEKLKEEVNQKWRKGVDSASRKADVEQKEKLDKLRKTSRIKNGAKIAELKNKLAIERRDFLAKMESLTESEKEAAVNSLKLQQDAEMDDLVHKLQVEQELELQKLAEELQARKEGLVFEMEAQLLKDMISEGKMDSETGDTLSVELEKANSEVLLWFDTERAKQRALLEEKSQLRRHCAMQKELWDQQYDEIVDSLIKQYLDAVDYLAKKGFVNETEAQALHEEADKQMQQMRDWLDKERRSREAKLHKTAALEKKKRLSEMKSQQQKELENLAKTLKEKKASMTDPLESAREIQKLSSEHREHLRALENRLDTEATEELYKIYQDLEKELSQALEEKKNALLKSKSKWIPVNGFSNITESTSEADVIILITEHKEHMKILAEKHEYQRQRQLGKLEEISDQRKRRAVEQVGNETVEQTELRQNEKTIARMLINQQASLSDADRDTLVRLQLEHLANMKNGLAINRLHQIQLLEKKLAERKAVLIERLERKRHIASKPAKRSNRTRPPTGSSEQAGSSSMSSEDDRKDQNGAQQMSLTDYAQQRMFIARDTTVDIDKEMESIRQTLLPQRARSQKEREENLGVLVAKLQIEKAKQIVELEQQEDALANLTTCMVEDLNERGVLSNPDCHRILEKHQIEQQRVSERLQEQKEKQDLVLQQQLWNRATKKREVLDKKQLRLSESRPITAVQHIDNINNIHSYALERENLMQQSERELEQALQEQRREFELRKRQALQDQEIDLINNLVQMGEFNKTEVSGVLRMLFPDKTKVEVRELTKKVYKKSPSDKVEKPAANSTTQTSLAKRLEITSQVKQLIEDRASTDSESSGVDTRRKRDNGVRVQYPRPRPRSRPRTHLPPISRRPEPVGASVDQVAEFLPDKRIARLNLTQAAATRQTFHQ